MPASNPWRDQEKDTVPSVHMSDQPAMLAIFVVVCAPYQHELEDVLPMHKSSCSQVRPKPECWHL